jgi:hypothetical protein
MLDPLLGKNHAEKPVILILTLLTARGEKSAVGSPPFEN